MQRTKIYWTEEAWRDYQIYCQLSHPNEIAGMGRVVLVDGKPVIRELFLIDQEVSGGAADFDDEKYSEWYVKVYRGELGYKPEELRLWWHTHPNMSVEFSAKDRNTIEKIRTGSEWFIAVVINERGDRQGELYVKDPPFLPPYKIEKDDFIIIRSEDRTAELKKEFEAKVTKKTYSYTTTPSTKPGSRGYYGIGGDWEDWEGYGGAWRTAQNKPSVYPHQPHGGYNGLGKKDVATTAGGNGKSQQSVPTSVEKEAPNMRDEKIDCDLPPAEVMRENVANDIIINVRALLGGKK